MLTSGPILDRREPEPIGRAILRCAMGRMAGGKMFVRIPAHQQRPRFMGPFLIAETIEVIPQVPRNVRESRKARDGVTDITPLILAPGRGLSFVRGDLEDRRNNHIAITRIAEHPFPLLPVRNIEAREVDLWVVETFGLRRHP